MTSCGIQDPVVRRFAFAIRAFNIELAQIRDLTSHENIAQMRLKFWSEAVDVLFSESETNKFEFASNHQPVMRELKSVSLQVF